MGMESRVGWLVGSTKVEFTGGGWNELDGG